MGSAGFHAVPPSRTKQQQQQQILHLAITWMGGRVDGWVGGRVSEWASERVRE